MSVDLNDLVAWTDADTGAEHAGIVRAIIGPDRPDAVAWIDPLDGEEHRHVPVVQLRPMSGGEQS